ncbi:SAG-related sequence SRS56 [Toxoplasma gondii RUB]|uniref:SAG-related sequence SRS56 n=6 Tax=Toxoplasma gondii TaxID=5811 RepID=A0A086M6U8_TOXGO|nr:SAG-related sequence SRS56 [Toxoplasma gondii p89]KFG53891.1 SAG-related sequence SRS56 [Toxoplasma gondii FOU]KFG64616.1 SAG-related sequence SRS56 [Toxoplasma gondii RUB]KFH12492.1 SAG-related sequence SRS56 [Toxoplasma gondii VAND]KFH16220.1 SAG-related sequence SRS56 [Toxoplasma gondii MAS]PUA90480.1 SAG-related sequence SRS56 [Toxoplasma gondii TgCATBr9]
MERDIDAPHRVSVVENITSTSFHSQDRAPIRLRRRWEDTAMATGASRQDPFVSDKRRIAGPFSWAFSANLVPFFLFALLAVYLRSELPAAAMGKSNVCTYKSIPVILRIKKPGEAVTFKCGEPQPHVLPAKVDDEYKLYCQDSLCKATAPLSDVTITTTAGQERWDTEYKVTAGRTLPERPYTMYFVCTSMESDFEERGNLEVSRSDSYTIYQPKMCKVQVSVWGATRPQSFDKKYECGENVSHITHTIKERDSSVTFRCGPGRFLSPGILDVYVEPPTYSSLVSLGAMLPFADLHEHASSTRDDIPAYTLAVRDLQKTRERKLGYHCVPDSVDTQICSVVINVINTDYDPLTGVVGSEAPSGAASSLSLVLVLMAFLPSGCS